MKAYINLGLTDEQIIEMQQWLYPMMNETKTISEMIKKVVGNYPEGVIRHYALYHLGNRIGEAQVKEQLHIDCVLDPKKL